MKTYKETIMKRLIAVTCLVLCLSLTALADGNLENPSKNGNLENPSRIGNLENPSSTLNAVLNIVKLQIALKVI